MFRRLTTRYCIHQPIQKKNYSNNNKEASAILWTTNWILHLLLRKKYRLKSNRKNFQNYFSAHKEILKMTSSKILKCGIHIWYCTYQRKLIPHVDALLRLLFSYKQKDNISNNTDDNFTVDWNRCVTYRMFRVE